MLHGQWERVRDLFHQALDLPPEERRNLLVNACFDTPVRAEVESLLANHEYGEDLLAAPALEGSREVIGAALSAAGGTDSLATDLIGATIAGRYDIQELLGRGGHAVVYTATDRKLGNRKVVLKVPDADTDRRDWLHRKFQQEVAILGRISHAGVVGIRDCGQLQSGQPYLVLDFVEGVNLRQRLCSPLETAEIACIIRQLGSALKAAHAQGITHRDVKPENVMVETGGDPGRVAVKLIDFGIAQSPPADGKATSTVISGTMKYMAPEQVVGLASVASDIYSLGVVCFELLTGSTPYEGIDPAEFASGQHKTFIERRCHASGIPEAARPLLAAALAFDVSQRPHDAESFANSVADALIAVPGDHFLWFPKRVPLSSVALAIGGAVLAFAGVLSMRPSPDTPSPPTARQLTPDSAHSVDPALSPDGDFLAYASDGGYGGPFQIWVRRLPDGNPSRLTNVSGGAREPAISPDATTIVFRSDGDGGGIHLIPASGGQDRKIAERGRRPRFSPDGKWIAYYVGELKSGNSRVYVVPAQGGAPRWLKRNCGFSAGSPVWSPDGKGLLFWCEGSDEHGKRDADWWVTALDSGESVKTGAFDCLANAALEPAAHRFFIPEAWVGDRILFSARYEGSISTWSIPISPTTWTTQADPRPATSNLAVEAQAAIGVNSSGSTAMVFGSLSERTDLWSLPVNGNLGTVTGEIKKLTHAGGRNFWPSATADGRFVSFVSDRTGIPSLWIKDLSTGRERLLVSDISLGPKISADGSKIVYSTVEKGTRGVHVVSTAPGAQPSKLCEDCGYPWTWAPDRTALLTDSVYDELSPYLRHRRGFYWIDVASGRQTLMPTRNYCIEPRISPDGGWVALYFLNTLDTRQIFVAPLRTNAARGPQLGDRETWVAVTDGNGVDRNPVWSPDGNLLYFQSEREGFRCIWARRLDSVTKKPLGEAFPVYHSHSARLSLANAGHESAAGLSVTRDRLIFSQGESTGAIWLTRFE